MRKLVVGILAHVDAGKTTLSESMLFLSGKIRRLGRVDNKDAYLDTYALEKQRGITIFSKQAVMAFDDTEITLMDTPGHVDFSAEMERTLQILDYAILVVNGADGVQGHTKTLWELLRIYRIPTFIFVNKMDQQGTDADVLMTALATNLSDKCLAFDGSPDVEWFEQLALCDEEVMTQYLETEAVTQNTIKRLVWQRKVFPVYFGSALRQIGVDAFVEGLLTYSVAPTYPESFGAKVFKITRDAQGNRLTHLKVTGGLLKVKDTVESAEGVEKINQIRIYSGEKFVTADTLTAGSVCAVTGLTQTKPGEGLGIDQTSMLPILEPVLSYRLILPADADVRVVLPKLREIEEEEPALKIVWHEVLQEINVQIMGAVQIEVLQAMLLERFDLEITFGDVQIVYKETIDSVVEGVGHFEPLRHYAEVHLLMEPGERGSGMQFFADCSEDELDKNWQRLVLTHLNEKNHIGVLTGSPLTDMKVTLVAGRGHNKHTEGGDFREATFRALRQGLKEATSVLLEPYYQFRMELPENYVGRAMTDIDHMQGHCLIESTEGGVTVLVGDGPVATLRNYQQELSAYTKGNGKMWLSIKGYDRCHNASEVIEAIAYDSERDVLNPTGSVFCAHGSGYLVPWDEVKGQMHVEAYLKPERRVSEDYDREMPSVKGEEWISLEEIDEIFNRTYYANQGRKNAWKRPKSAKESYYDSVTYKGTMKAKSRGEAYLLVDGYNIIFAWPELDKLAQESMDGARLKLIDILSNYQAIKQCQIILVFDAYRVAGHKESSEMYHNIRVVFTAEAQTADHYIEKFAHTHQKDYQITVATSDGLQQIIIRGAGAALLSARELREAVLAAEETLSKEHLSQENTHRTTIEEVIGEAEKAQLKKSTQSED
ncbi:MAG: TetM/TetW/TetO/TetS family tetracycline resistance ribosomal protection protein [Clostridia bacterium]|nr:TetM/TetW/TetO/TetS family tetracycline resistance ribosomal protection protein [Clostridia bacterium]